ncbi:MAG: penicillin acylase family protein [Elusimicrobiota bacterium]|nr:penicillin acylase family protein [Elusimicrobiota bacterium]
MEKARSSTISGFLSAILCAGLLSVGLRGFSRVPALEAIIDPVRGIWKNTAPRKHTDVKLGSLHARSAVIWNKTDIPYIFSSTPEDLYRVQGYVLASQRLWQMEFLARATAGRLSELYGPMALDLDKFNRAAALPRSAEIILAEAMKDPFTKMALEAYAEGVNEYIKTLDKASRPVEYKFFNVYPEPWTPLKSALVYISLSWQLSGYDSRAELRRSNTLQRLGQDRFQRIFPAKRPWAHPMTNSVCKPRTAAGPVPDEGMDLQFIPIDKGFWPPPGIGSNAWAVRFGSPGAYSTLLASDPHLPLTSPSIWFLNQLSDGGHTVLGASVPGVPGVIVGSNSDYAWSVTNGGLDVVDWYGIKFKDDSWSEYELDGAWVRTTRRNELIRVRGSKEVNVPVTFTHHGPVSFGYESGGKRVGLAMHWSGHSKTNPFAVFLRLDRGADRSAFKAALAGLSMPLNFLYADRKGNIAGYTAGSIPERLSGTGKHLSDGSRSANDWRGYLPSSEAPRTENPKSNYVFSANQDPVGANSHVYLGIFPPDYRAARIEELLRAGPVEKIGTHLKMQLDEKCPEAEIVLPELLKLVSRKELSPFELQALGLLLNWDFLAAANDPAPSVFEAWWRTYRKLAWEKEAGKDAALMEPPGTDLYAAWLTGNKDSSAKTPPDSKAPGRLATEALHQAVLELVKKYGAAPAQWQWGKINEVTIAHVSRIPNFGQRAPWVNGGLQSLNAFHGSYGPSLRLIVQFDSHGPKVMAGYPGGASGNPGDPLSASLVNEFMAGKLNPVAFALKETDLPADSSVQIFRSSK